MRVLLISTYDLGRQPFGLASPAAWLRDAGLDVACLDLSRQPFEAAGVPPGLVAFHLPMHTATRLAVRCWRRCGGPGRTPRSAATGCTRRSTRRGSARSGVRHILGAEFEPRARGRSPRPSRSVRPPPPAQEAPRALPRPAFVTPDRSGLPPLSRYAPGCRWGGERRTAGYTEASRGCKHTCRHCPVVPVYSGRFRVVPVDVVVDDVRGQVQAGARHVTFGDPDFFNGPGHACAWSSRSRGPVRD